MFSKKSELTLVADARARRPKANSTSPSTPLLHSLVVSPSVCIQQRAGIRAQTGRAHATKPAVPGARPNIAQGNNWQWERQGAGRSSPACQSLATGCGGHGASCPWTQTHHQCQHPAKQPDAARHRGEASRAGRLAEDQGILQQRAYIARWLFWQQRLVQIQGEACDACAVAHLPSCRTSTHQCKWAVTCNTESHGPWQGLLQQAMASAQPTGKLPHAGTCWRIESCTSVRRRAPGPAYHHPTAPLQAHLCLEAACCSCADDDVWIKCLTGQVG